MQAPMPHPAEAKRLEAVEASCLLDSPRELSFDLLAHVAADVAETDIALVTVLDEKRQWFKARIGLDVEQTERNIAFCGHAILQRHPLIIENALEDDRFRDNPLVVQSPNIRFYAGFPIHSRDGYPIGTLCVIHTKPKRLTERQVTILKRLAQQVELAVEVRRRIIEVENVLAGERDAQRMRELLCQALIHDMKSPMMVVTLAAEALQGRHVDDDLSAKLISEILVASDTLARMVFDALDMVHGTAPKLTLRLEWLDLSQLVARVHDSFERVFAARGQHLVLENQAEVVARVDPEVLRRVLHNLLDNAYKYAPEGTEIELGCRTEDGKVVLWVSDEGPGIPAKLQKTVFELYARIDPEGLNHGRSGHGIGLAFCQLAVGAHQGSIEIKDAPGHGCRFQVTLPVDPCV